MQKILFSEPEKCSGCRSCESACSIHHEKVFNPARARIHVVKWEENGVYVPIVCQHCETPLCEAVCPMHALSRDEETGALLIDYDLCVGCKLCISMCPFGGVNLNVKTGKPVKCDLCGGDPLCVKFCEPKALQYLDASTMNLKKRRAAAERLSNLMKKLFTPV